MTQVHGGILVARALAREGVDAVFTLTGGHILPLLDGCIQEGIRVIDTRHEQAAGHAAEAYSRLTGQLGVAMVTAGPGVTDTVTAIATAFHSATPMLVIGGRHMIRQELRGGLQEMDHPKLFGSITKWAATAWQLERLPDYIATAARYAFSGRGGPVFLDIPMDVQFDAVEETAVRFPDSYRANRSQGLPAEQLDEVVNLLAAAEKLVVFAGTGRGQVEGRSLAELATILSAPTYVNASARGSLSCDHAFLANRTRTKAFEEADVVLALGVDWDFRTSYGEKIGAGTQVIQIDSDEAKVGWNRSVDIGLVADPMMAVAQIVERLGADSHHRSVSDWTEELMKADRSKEAAALLEASTDESPIAPQRFAKEVSEFFGEDAIVAVDGGDIVSTTVKWLKTSTAGHVLDPGPFGSLGTGPPYAIAAQVAFPDRLVGIVFGDGGFGFNAMEYDTMVRHNLPIIGVMGNDGVWSNIKTLHRVVYPDRLVATDLGRRPYHDMVTALGGHGELVTEPAQIGPALERARASGLPSLVNVHIAETMRMSSNYSQ